MAGIWPVARPEPRPTASVVGSPIVIAAPVSSLTWQSAAALANFLRGKGACLVPECFPERSITTGVTESFRFRTKTRNTAVQRIWFVTLRTGSASLVTADIRAPAAGTFALHTVALTSLRPAPVMYVETLGSKATAEAEILIDIRANGGTVIVDSIACYEQDRPLLNLDTTDYGTDTTTLINGQPIADFAFQSLGGVWDGLANADARRAGIYHLTFGDGVGCAKASAGYAELLQIGVPVLAQKAGRTATTGGLRWSVYAKVAGGAGGNVRMLTSQSGVSDVTTVTSTSYTWTHAAATSRAVTVSCEDMASDDGRQTAASPVTDLMTFQIQGDGANALIVRAISVFQQ